VKRNSMMLTSLLSLVFLFGACRSAPIYNVAHSPIKMYKPDYTATDVEKAIMKAGLSQGWKMAAVSPGTIRGTLDIRAHQAVVVVRYDTKEYSINYESSQNLDHYQGQIHKNYNAWIRHLDNAIQRELLD
jgi:hypothetical protein